MDEGSNELRIQESDPGKAVQFIKIILNNALRPPNSSENIKWDKYFADLSVKWLITDYVAIFSTLAESTLKTLIQQAKVPEATTYRPAYGCIAIPGQLQVKNNTMVASFWEIAELVLSHEPFQQNSIPLKDNLDLVQILSERKNLWKKENMVSVLSKEDIYELCLKVAGRQVF